MYRRSRWADWQKVVLWMLVFFIIAAGAIAAFRYFTRTISPIPKDISSKLTFSPFIIGTSSRYTTDSYKFTTAEDSVQILSYVVHPKDGPSISVSEYTQPPQFTDIPEYKDRFLTNVAKQYATVSTSNGTIYLGRMAKQDNKQLAVMIEKGLLIFMAPKDEINEAQWRSLGDNFEILKLVD